MTNRQFPNRLISANGPTGQGRSIMYNDCTSITNRRFRRLLASVGATVLLASLATATGARAAPAGYDGPGSVMIITESGACDQSYAFPVKIAGNRVISEGVANVTGTVGRGGNVAVRVSAGESFANGTGRLNGTSGAGRWSGRGSAGVCKGRWQATRS